MSSYQHLTDNLRCRYLDDSRPWLVGFSGGKESTLDRMRRCSQQHGLNIEAHLIKPPPEQSFRVNIIGRGYPLAKRREN